MKRPMSLNYARKLLEKTITKDDELLKVVELNAEANEEDFRYSDFFELDIERRINFHLLSAMWTSLSGEEQRAILHNAKQLALMDLKEEYKDVKAMEDEGS